MDEIDIENVTMNDADEYSEGLMVSHQESQAARLWNLSFMFSKQHLCGTDWKSNSGMCSSNENVEIHHAKITTKDASWEVEKCDHLRFEPNGEYPGWYLKNHVWSTAMITGEQTALCT